MVEIFAPSFLCVRNKILQRNLQKSVASRFFCMHSFDDSMNIQNLRSWGSISSKTVPIFPKDFLNFSLDTIEKKGMINFSSYNS